MTDTLADRRAERAARREASAVVWALIHLAQHAGLGPVCAEHGWLAGAMRDGACLWCIRDRERQARQRRGAVRRPPRPPYEGQRGRCALCGETPPKGRRTWCSDGCVALWFIITSGTEAYGHLVALHGVECWRCCRRTEMATDWRGMPHERPVTLAVDHVRPLWSLRDHERQNLRWWTPANLQLLCTECHADKTRHEAGLRARAKREGVRPSTVWLAWSRLYAARMARPGALVHVGHERCPSCGLPAEDDPVAEQLPLLRHGGYGASTVRRVRRCSCGWSLLVEVSEARPTT